MFSYKVKAIVLRFVNFSEADRLVSLFTQKRGKITCLAKGVRKINSKRSGHLQTFSQITAQVSETKGLDIITQAQNINNFAQLRKDLDLTQMAFTACELVNSLTAESQAQPETYALLSRFLTHLNTGKPINNAVFEFQKKLLELLGFGVPDNSTPQSLETFTEEIIGHSLKSPEITA